MGDGKVSTKKYQTKKFSSIVVCNPTKAEIKNLSDKTLVSFVEMSSLSKDGFISHRVTSKLGLLKKGSYRYFCDNDIIVAKITPCMKNGNVH